ncbi:hypothetical protein [Nonomuraea sp. NPDC005692]
MSLGIVSRLWTAGDADGGCGADDEFAVPDGDAAMAFEPVDAAPDG